MMDTIEIRPMESDIQTVPTATLSPAAPGGEQARRPARECPPDADGHVYFSRCDDAKEHTLPDMYLTNTGRVMDVNLTLKRVCPCRRVAVGMFVSEIDRAGNEYARGFKAITVPAHYNSACCDVDVPRARFILPEDLRVDGEVTPGNGLRHFIVRAEAHYIDNSVTMP